MSRYDKLSEQMSDILNEKTKLDKLTKEFISNLINELKLYLGIEDDNLNLLKPDSKCSYTEHVQLWKAVVLQTDNFWHFQIQITIEHQNKRTRRSWCYKLAVKPKENDIFFLELFNPEGTPLKDFIIDINNPETTIDFYEYMNTRLENAISKLKYKFD
jgi:hypothetical protein